MKVIVRKLDRSPKAKTARVTERRERDATGKLRTVRTLDMHSPSFGEDLAYVFARNVARARRENKRVAGVTDVAPTGD